MCDCINQVEKMVKENYKAEKAEFMCQTIIPYGRLYSEVQVKLPRKKTMKLVSIHYGYCPICGEKYQSLGEESGKGA